MLLARSYSHYSLLSAVAKIEPLINFAKEKGYSTVALTDEDTTSGLVEFYELAKKIDLNSSLGTTLRIKNVSNFSSDSFERNTGFSKIALLPKSEEGYKAVLELVSIARVEKEKPNYHIELTDLLKYKNEENNLPFFVLITGLEHEIGQLLSLGKNKESKEVLAIYQQSLGSQNLLVELLLARFNDNKDQIHKLNLELYNYCLVQKIKPIVSPAPRHLNIDEAEAFQVVLAIKKQVRIYDIELERNFNLPSVDELKEEFKDFPEALNTQDIEDQIKIKIRTDYDKYASEAFFPFFHLPEGQDAGSNLIWISYIGLIAKFHPDSKSIKEWKEIYKYEDTEKLIEDCKKIIPETKKLLGYPSDYWNKKTMLDYVERIQKELDIIITKGYPSYFLVVSDIMQFCRDKRIVISTRGSAAGSLVGYLTGINILDPLVYDIPFERFLNPFRPSAPDIDGDFADDRRGEVIDYLVQKYGRDKVSQIITFGTMLPRAAVRDIGRVLGVAYRKCDQLSKLIPTAPQGKKTSFKWAFETSEELRQVYEKDGEVKRIIDIAKKIEANHRHASVHAAGLIITPTKLTDYCALQWDSDHKQVACQYDMRIGEKMGLVKMDLLGITNLSILGNAVNTVKKRRGIDVDLYNLNLSDQRTFNLLASGKTMGLFQLSGPAMTKYLVQLEPTKVQDLMAMVALYRPGPMANIPEYIKRKKDPNLISYTVPQMKDWMEESYGILVYQDDLLYMTIYLAGYDWGEADTFRKGVGKKIQSILDSQHERFVTGCIEHSKMDKETAEGLWDIMVPFAAYGFNKAHSANYGMVAYWTAYMKANYPAEFMTALMTSEEGNMDKISSAINECYELGIKILPPDINTSYSGYTIIDETTIRYGLGSVKNLGSDVINFIIQERNDEGEYTSLSNFITRMAKANNFNKRSLEALVQSGALDLITEKEISKIL
jgi:DNA polymerase III subunit alpha